MRLPALLLALLALAPAARSEFEFRGIIAQGPKTIFGVIDSETGTTQWISVGDTFSADWTLLSYDSGAKSDDAKPGVDAKIPAGTDAKATADAKPAATAKPSDDGQPPTTPTLVFKSKKDGSLRTVYLKTSIVQHPVPGAGEVVTGNFSFKFGDNDVTQQLSLQFGQPNTVTLAGGIVATITPTKLDDGTDSYQMKFEQSNGPDGKPQVISSPTVGTSNSNEPFGMQVGGISFSFNPNPEPAPKP